MNFRTPFRQCGCSLAILLALALSAAAGEPDAARVLEIAGWLRPEPVGAAEPISNRAAWQRLAQQPGFAGAIERAAALAGESIPAQPDELYLDYSRTGNRERWQKVAFNRRSMVQTLVLAECLEHQGRFIAPLEKLIAALCEEPTWVYPAHDYSLKNFRGQEAGIDLGSSALGWELATANRLLGDKLSPKTRQLIRDNLERRIFKSFRDSVRGPRGGNWWMTARNNWNAVCLAGVAGAALATLDSPGERAWFIAATEDYIRNFLSGFTVDGYCSEGVGYWNYGFGHFSLLAETVRRSTGGKLDWLADPKATKPALFGAQTEILAGIYPSIADCSPASQPSLALMTFLANRFDFELPMSLRTASPKLARSLAEALTYANAPAPPPQVSARKELDDLTWRTWFPDGGVLICRPGPGKATPFAACLKGGHNDEHHNHNDVGTFMIVSGKTMLLCDPGSEVYTSRTFSARRGARIEIHSRSRHAAPRHQLRLPRS